MVHLRHGVSHAAKYLFPFAIFTALALRIPAAAEDVTAATIDKMTKAYGQIKAIDVTAEREDTVGGSSARLTSTQYHYAEKIGGLYLVEIKQSGERLLKVSDGEKTWKAMSELKRFTVIQASASSSFDDAGSPDDILSITRSIFLRFRLLKGNLEEAEYIKDDQLKLAKSKVECTVLRVRVKGHTSEIWIDKQTGLVLQYVEDGTHKEGSRVVPATVKI